MLTSISLPTFFSRKTTKFLLARTLTSKPRHKEDRRRLPVMHKGQLDSRSPYIGRSRPHRAPPAIAYHYASCALAAPLYTFVSRRRRVLSRDLGAEMLLIMRPDKPALCRVLSITRTIFHERSAQRNRYMPPRLSSSLGDVWSPLFYSLTTSIMYFSFLVIQKLWLTSDYFKMLLSCTISSNVQANTFIVIRIWSSININ